MCLFTCSCQTNARKRCINKPDLPKTAAAFGMLIASRCLAATYLGRIAQHHTRRCAQSDCKRRGPVRSLPYIVRSMSNEGQAAQKSVASGAPGKAEQGEETLFDKIVSKKIPATILYEDETALAFKDINPQAPVHFLVIPKNRDGLTQLSKSTDRHELLLGHLIRVASKVARQGQSVYHLHVHVFGGKQLGWPPC